MKTIRFLPFLAACLGLSAERFASEIPKVEAKKQRKLRSKRDRITTSVYGRRWSWGFPHLGSQQEARLQRRAILDAKAAASNYLRWCGREDAGALRV